MKFRVLNRSIRPRPGLRRPSSWLPHCKAAYFLEVRHRRYLLLHWQPWFGIWPASLWRVPSTVGAPLAAWDKPETSMRKKTAASPTEDKREHLAAIESKVLADLFPIVKHIATTRYDDGDPRKPGWVTIKTQGSSWVVQIKDPDSCSSFQCVAATIDDALSLASLMLEAESTPWEHDKWLADAARPRGKK